jgi:GH24 family phage-related lysozyme (muramidase)
MEYVESNLMMMLKDHEGSGKGVSYEDVEGNLTAGFGHLVVPGDVDLNGNPITNKGQAISDEQAERWFKSDTDNAVQRAGGIYGFDRMSASRQKAMIDLTFNMGIGWTNKFPNAVGYAKDAVNSSSPERAKANWWRMARELEYKDGKDIRSGHSKYWKQTKRRAKNITKMIREG